MEIKEVTLHEPSDDKLKAGAVAHFEVVDNEGATMIVPADPANRHYHEVAEWFKAQKKKPFKFDF